MIEIWTEELPPNWRWHPKKFLGGTPETVVNLAENFDDNVIVYYDGEPCNHNGVYYLPREDYQARDILIAVNSTPENLAQYNIYTTSWFHARDYEYPHFDERIVLSPYHQKIFGENSRIIPLGCNKELFYGGDKIQKQCLFSSSPDRGADFLDSIWSDVEKETGAKLIKTYNINISEEEMIDFYKSSQFWLHPGQGIELFCISALKAQVSGCIPVFVPNMALETTLEYGIRTSLGKFKEDLISAIKSPPEVGKVNAYSWKEIANEYLAHMAQGAL